HDADPLVGPVPEAPAQLLAVADAGRVEPGDVAGEVVVVLDPVADRRQPGPGPGGDDVVGGADEHGPVAEPREAGDVLDHLGVVVGGHEGLAVPPVGHGQPADEVGEPGVGGPLLLGVLVQEVAQLPGLVPDPPVVRLLADDVVEDHEVGDQDLVHPPDRLEGVQAVLGRLPLDVGRLVGQPGAGRVIRSPSASRPRVTGSWASQSISRPGTCARSSRAMARSRRAWPSPMGEDRYRARLGRRRARVQVRAAGVGPTPTKSATTGLTLTGARAWGAGPPPSSGPSRPRSSPARSAPPEASTWASSVPWITRTGQRTRGQSAATSPGSMILVSQPRNPARIVSIWVPIAQPTQSSTCWVECSSVRHMAKKNSRYPGQSRSQYPR